MMIFLKFCNFSKMFKIFRIFSKISEDFVVFEKINEIFMTFPRFFMRILLTLFYTLLLIVIFHRSAPIVIKTSIIKLDISFQIF